MVERDIQGRNNSGAEIRAFSFQAGIDVICGPMFSGKSTELVRRAKRLPHAGFKVQAFKPSKDNRRGESSINSEDGLSLDADSVISSTEILGLVKTDTHFVVIDEGQFFDHDLPDVCRQLASQGKRVIVAGLDKNFKGEPFGPMGELKQEADHVDTLYAFCKRCGRPASMTQRIKIINGERAPASYNDEEIMVGATEAYEARCRDHHEVPGRPSRIFPKEPDAAEGIK